MAAELLFPVVPGQPVKASELTTFPKSRIGGLAVSLSKILRNCHGIIKDIQRFQMFAFLVFLILKIIYLNHAHFRNSLI